MNQVYIWSFYFMFSGKSSQTGHNVVMPTCYAYSHEFYTIVFMFWYVFSQSQPLCSGVLQNVKLSKSCICSSLHSKLTLLKGCSQWKWNCSWLCISVVHILCSHILFYLFQNEQILKRSKSLLSNQSTDYCIQVSNKL